MVSSKELLEILRLLTQIDKIEKANLFRYCRDLQENVDRSVLPASDQEIKRE